MLPLRCLDSHHAAVVGLDTMDAKDVLEVARLPLTSVICRGGGGLDLAMSWLAIGSNIRIRHPGLIDIGSCNLRSSRSIRSKLCALKLLFTWVTAVNKLLPAFEPLSIFHSPSYPDDALLLLIGGLDPFSHLLLTPDLHRQLSDARPTTRPSSIQLLQSFLLDTPQILEPSECTEL